MKLSFLLNISILMTLWPILIFSFDNWNAWKYQTNCLFYFKFFTLLHNHTLGYVRKDVKIFLLGTKMDTILASKSKISSTTFWNFKFLCSSSVPLLFWWVFFRSNIFTNRSTPYIFLIIHLKTMLICEI